MARHATRGPHICRGGCEEESSWDSFRHASNLQIGGHSRYESNAVAALDSVPSVRSPKLFRAKNPRSCAQPKFLDILDHSRANFKDSLYHSEEVWSVITNGCCQIERARKHDDGSLVNPSSISAFGNGFAAARSGFTYGFLPGRA